MSKNTGDKPIALIVLLINLTEIMFMIATSVNHDATRNRGIGIFEFSFFRNFFGLLFSIPVFFYFQKGLFEDITRDMIVPLVIRIIVGNTCFFTWTYVYKLLPMGIGQVICASNPFLVVLFAPCMFATEKAGLNDLVGIIFSFLGILIMALSKPGSDADIKINAEAYYLSGIIFALITMIFLAVLILTGRYLKSIHFSVIQLHYGIVGMIMAIIMMFFETKPQDRSFFVYDSS
jgi:drug/metabolite transporter (DMT)-like permease